ncbi:hypothetical protein [Desulfosporosinus sp. SB140]|uniref:hypothetical protein n=1 Tax=Desulfosporosinus paludis TaxID=3115649 RepID=UPI00388D7A9E
MGVPEGATPVCGVLVGGLCRSGKLGKKRIGGKPSIGSKLLFASVFTNADLESTVYQSVSDDVNNVCDNCRQCIKACPTKAFEGKQFHKVRCFPNALRGCSECVQVCKGQNTHMVVRLFKQQRTTRVRL